MFPRSWERPVIAEISMKHYQVSMHRALSSIKEIKAPTTA
jgi:hypothetical protein